MKKIFIVLLIGFTATICFSQTDQDNKGFNFILKHGVAYSYNVINTFESKLTKDLIFDGQITVDFNFSASQMDSILVKIKKIKIFSIENYVTRNSDTIISSPVFSYYLKIKIQKKVKEIRWEEACHYKGKSRDTVNKLDDLKSYILNIVHNDPRYKKLPESNGFYF